MGNKLEKLIQENDAKWLDLRFSDSRGGEHHVTLPARDGLEEKFFKQGKYFDGSSIEGWQGIHESDMKLMPFDETATIDPFADATTVTIKCNVVRPDGEFYPRCPRSVSIKAEKYLKSTGIAEEAYFGPEPEFFVFDDVKFTNQIGQSGFTVFSKEASWASGMDIEDGNTGHRPGVKGGYFPVPPVDSLNDIRGAMCEAMELMGIQVEVHHHEVATAGQCEIGTMFNTLTTKGDEVANMKYCVRQVADQWGKTATFMPKPLVGDNGSGMHIHQSLARDGQNVFSGDVYAGLSQEALYYIGGTIKHAKAINAFTNATTNSYKRLVPGFEAPDMVVYSSTNRSAAIRIPKVPSPKARRIEVRFPDASGNPYLAMSALLMAGLDGIRNKIDPGNPQDIDLYAASESQVKDIPRVCRSLEQALESLSADREFLCHGDVFTDDLIDAYINLKMEEVTALHQSTHPIEYLNYYSC